MDNRIYGVLHKVRYFKEETGFGIVRIKLDYEDPYIKTFQEELFSSFLSVTCTFDRLPLIEEEYEFIGEFVDTDYGLQFKANQFKRKNEQSKESIITYLASDFFPGIGKSTATKIVSVLGEGCVDAIAQDKKILSKVKGLTKKQKDTIYDNIVENKITKEATAKLLDLGITFQTANRLVAILGITAYDILIDNPYILMDKVDGFGFHRSDKIAMEVGIKKDDPRRMEALMRMIIDKQSYAKGDTYCIKEDIFRAMEQELHQEVSTELLEHALASLKDKEQIVIDEEGDIFHKRIFDAETLLARKVKELLHCTFDYGYELKNIQTAMEKMEKASQLEYTDRQQEAIQTALTSNCCIITGGPGTGKSTVIKGIVDTYIGLHQHQEVVKESIALLAPTGRAAKRLKEVTGCEAQTIHRFLGFEGNGRFRHGLDLPVDCKMVVVDEFSMVDVELAARLFSALYPFTKVILVGDKDQLPSVGPGEVLNDMIASNLLPVVWLDRIHRQAEQSSIVGLAHLVNQGKLPEDLVDKKGDRVFLSMQDSSLVGNILITIDQAIQKRMDIIRDIQVLIPMYKGEIGIDAVNEAIQKAINPKQDVELVHNNRVFRVNDKVIQLVNRSDKQVMNGDIGHIWRLDLKNDAVVGLEVMYDFGSVYYKKEELEDIMHAYAISIHKAQGSEFDLVIVPFTLKHSRMLERKLIYTAITRAKKYLILLGNMDALKQGIRGIGNARRTKLQEKLSNTIKKSNPLATNDVEIEDKSPYDFMD